MSRYYIGYTSIFDGDRKYSTAKISSAVKKHGGSNVRLSYQYGWPNQPKVVCFDADSEKDARHIADKASDDVFPRNRSSLIHLIAYRKNW